MVSARILQASLAEGMRAQASTSFSGIISPALMFWVEAPEIIRSFTVLLAVISCSRVKRPSSMASMVSRAVITLVMLAGYIFSWAFCS